MLVLFAILERTDSSCGLNFICCCYIHFSSYNVADRQLSLSSPPPTDSTGKHVPQFQDENNDDKFFSVLDDEMAKVEKFTLSKVTELRAELTAIEKSVENLKMEEDKIIIQKEVRIFIFFVVMVET